MSICWWTLDSFYLLSIVNNATINSNKFLNWSNLSPYFQYIWNFLKFNFLSIYKNEIAESYGNSVLFSEEETYFSRGCSILCSHQQSMKDLTSPLAFQNDTFYLVFLWLSQCLLLSVFLFLSLSHSLSLSVLSSLMC